MVYYKSQDDACSLKASSKEKGSVQVRRAVDESAVDFDRRDKDHDNNDEGGGGAYAVCYLGGPDMIFVLMTRSRAWLFGFVDEDDRGKLLPRMQAMVAENTGNKKETTSLVSQDGMHLCAHVPLKKRDYGKHARYVTLLSSGDLLVFEQSSIRKIVQVVRLSHSCAKINVVREKENVKLVPPPGCDVSANDVEIVHLDLVLATGEHFVLTFASTAVAKAWYKVMKRFVAGEDAKAMVEGDDASASKSHHRRKSSQGDGGNGGVMRSLKSTFSFYTNKVAERVSDRMGLTQKGLLHKSRPSVDAAADLNLNLDAAEDSAPSGHHAGRSKAKSGSGMHSKAKPSPRVHGHKTRRPNYRTHHHHHKQSSRASPLGTAAAEKAKEKASKHRSAEHHRGNKHRGAERAAAGGKRHSAGEWQKFTTDDGKRYYYNAVTKETKWHLSSKDRYKQSKAKAGNKKATTETSSPGKRQPPKGAQVEPPSPPKEPKSEEPMKEEEDRFDCSPRPGQLKKEGSAHGVEDNDVLRNTRRRLKSIAMREDARQQSIENADFLSSSVDKIISDWSKSKTLAQMLETLPQVLQKMEKGVLSPISESSSSPHHSWGEIRKAYAKALRIVHPDKQKADASAYDKLVCQRIFILIRDKMNRERDLRG